MVIKCSICHKRCTQDISDDIIVRGIMICPECFEKIPPSMVDFIFSVADDTVRNIVNDDPYDIGG